MPVPCLGPIAKEKQHCCYSHSSHRKLILPMPWSHLSFSWVGNHVDIRGGLPAYAAAKQPEWIQEYCSFLPSAHQHSDSSIPYRQQLTTHSGTRVGAFPGRPLQQNRAFRQKPANIKASFPPPQNCLSSDSVICIILWDLVQAPGFLVDLSKFYLGILPFLFFFTIEIPSRNVIPVLLGTFDLQREVEGYLTQSYKQLSLTL